MLQEKLHSSLPLFSDNKFNLITYSEKDEKEKFTGQLKLDNKSFGTILLKNNGTYGGHLMNGKFHGQGVLYDPDGAKLSATSEQNIAQ